MKLEQRIDLLAALGTYMQSDDTEWEAAKQKAFAENRWFIPRFVNLAANNVAKNFLERHTLEALTQRYGIPPENPAPQKVGIAMAGNIPLVGVHDLLCTFLTGHIAVIKPSSKDEALVKHLVQKLAGWNEEAFALVVIANMLKRCDAYIATGSNNTARYFEYYFRNHPHIIRKNRTSVAVLTGKETKEELEKLADDVYQYFGLGCRNVTQIFVPEEYDFVPLLEAFKKYDDLIDHNKYKNNYDYNLAVHILNNRFYMTNGSLLLVEDPSPFSPIGQIHYQYYAREKDVYENLQSTPALQCIVGKNAEPFGSAQCPAVDNFADNVDTLAFLMNLPSNG